MRFKQRFCLLLAVLLCIGTIVPAAATESATAPLTATVTLTVSNQGTLAAANDGSVMLNKSVTVTDLNNDNKLTVDEALVAAHQAYNRADGYVAAESSYGGKSVTKLWGTDTANTLFFINHVGLSTTVDGAEIANGNALVASVNADDTYYSDWYTFFDTTAKTVSVGEEFTLTLQGHLGMAYLPADMVDVAIPNAQIGTWTNGTVTQIADKKTDASGKVTLSFAEPGTYYLTASGTVKDEVTDWSTYEPKTVDCPIIAPGCVVTVTPSVASYLPAPGQFVNTDGWSNPNTTLSANTSGVTLGSFGGSLVWKFDTPIANDPKNPYGIDFIIHGNCFTDADGKTSAAAAEPAAVMVSEDGSVWYELAGSEYYTAEALHDVSVTYRNTDTAFGNAVAVPWTNSEGESGTMPVVESHTQNYFPNPNRYSAYQSGIGANTSYTAESLTVSGTLIPYGFYPFGYADSHSSDAELGKTAVNPYRADHQTTYNGDGFDLAWAVDANGNPVTLDSVSYIKVYNPVMQYGDARGELSPEITSITAVTAQESAVGVSGGLSALTVNGKNVPLTDGTYTYEVDGDGANSLTVCPTASNSDANIYVSNLRVASGSETAPLAPVQKLRILVQEGDKEPVIYILNLTNLQTKENNATLSSLNLTPGDTAQTPTEDAVSFTVESSVEAVRLKPTLGYSRATATLSGTGLTSPVTLKHKTESVRIPLSYGTNTFTLTVTAADGVTTKDYTVTVTRESSSGGGSSSSSNVISVSFSLVGDRKHGSSGSHSAETWIAKTTVTVPKGSTVKYLTERMLNNAGLDYVSNGIYISEIDGLGEFDNGKNSGWMYRQNGYIADDGYADRTLSAGDVIKWFYTDDYTQESGYEGSFNNHTGGSAIGGASGNGFYTPDTDKDDTAQTETTQTVFGDIASHWAYDAIIYCSQNGLMQGTDTAVFAPDNTMTRAMLVTVLYRMDKASAAVQTENPFADVADGMWYTDAVLWAAANGIVNGVSDTAFAPDDTVTRAQIAAMFFRYAAYKGYDTAPRADLSAFADADVADWAVEALQWANGVGLIQGTSATELSPNATATRAQVASVLMRFCTNLSK